jgi:hypothetical protein
VTDEKWRKLAALIDLPDQARQEIENAIDIYRRLAVARPAPHQTRDKLTKVENLAGKLLDALADLDAEAKAALWDCAGAALPTIEPVEIDETERVAAQIARAAMRQRERSPTPRHRAVTLLDDHHASVARLQSWMATASRRLQRARPGADPENIRWLVRAIDTIVMKRTGSHLKRSNHSLDFAETVCRIADPEIGPGTVAEAIKPLGETRVK